MLFLSFSSPFSLYLMTYERQILTILMEVGSRGIKLNKLALHVYNMNSTLFFQPDLQDVHRSVHQYLLRNSRSKQSLIERMDRRGYYRLNPSATVALRQEMLKFDAEDVQKEAIIEDSVPRPDLSLSLFDDF